MSDYLLIESRDPFEDRSVDEDYALAEALVRHGDDVVFYLVQNGVLPARSGASAEGLARLVEAGVRVAADSFSLRERGIGSDELRSGVSAGELDAVLDAMEAGRKVMWL